MNAQRPDCCEQCPFARSTPKEYLDTMGDNAGKFIGQAMGPFLLPCHMNSAFDGFMENPDIVPLCAGAAKYRANLGLAEFLPEEVGRLPSDHARVFGSEMELYAHHKGISLLKAFTELMEFTAHSWLLKELHDSNLKIIPVKKP